MALSWIASCWYWWWYSGTRLFSQNQIGKILIWPRIFGTYPTQIPCKQKRCDGPNKQLHIIYTYSFICIYIHTYILTLHYITLYYITLHYITYIHIYIIYPCMAIRTTHETNELHVAMDIQSEANPGISNGNLFSYSQITPHLHRNPWKK